MATIEINPNWSALVGTALEEKFAIAELLQQTDHSAIFRVFKVSAPAVQATACLWTGDSEAARDLVLAWERAREIGNPHLSPPLLVGWLAQSNLLYAVMEAPDERLDMILRERPLDAQEAGEVLGSLLSALEALHAQRSVHGAISPDQVFTVGGLVKISYVDACMPVRYYAPESEGENWTVEADVWCLGATLFEILTQRRYEQGSRSEAARLPAPFNKIVHGCLDPDPRARWTLPEIGALQRADTIGQRGVKAPAVRESTPGWAYVIAGILALLIIMLLVVAGWRRGLERHTEAHAGALSAATDTGSRQHALQPTDSVASLTPPVAAAPAHGAASGNRSGWRVVLYTYNKRDTAQERATKLNAKRPKLDANVFAPYGERGPYLVVAGGAGTRDEALREKRRALALGMPRDTYIQGY